MSVSKVAAQNVSSQGEAGCRLQAARARDDRLDDLYLIHLSGDDCIPPI